MPQVLEIENIGSKGLNTDLSAWSLPPEFLTGGINFRVFGNQIQTAGGSIDWSTPPVDFKGGYVIHVGATSGQFWLVAGRSAVYVFDGSTWTDVSSVAGYTAIGLNQELDWTGCMMGEFPIINNPQVYPEYWGGPSLEPPSPAFTMQPLPWDFGVGNTWDDVNQQARIIRSHKTFMFALHLVNNGVEEKDAYRWSHPADINGLPPTWDDTDPLYLAGKANIGSRSGNIIDGLSLRDSFVIYSENGVNILDFDPNSSFVWRRREMSSVVGLLAKNALVEVKGRHFFLADGDIVMNDGNQVQSIMHNRVRRYISARISTNYFQRSFAVRNHPYSEIWFCVPLDGAEYPNLAMIYNFRDDSWSTRELPTTDTNIAHANFGSQASPEVSWDTWAGTWDSQSRIWGSSVRTPLDDTVVGVNNVNSELIFLDPSDERSVELGTRIERVGYPLGGHDDVTSITRIYPHIEGTQPVSIRFGSHDKAGGPIRWKPAVNFTPGIDRKVDIRTTGELHAWRIESLGFGNWNMSGMTIEYEAGAKR